MQQQPQTATPAWRMLAGGALAGIGASCAMAVSFCIAMLLFWWLIIPLWIVLECVFPAVFALKLARLSAQPSPHAPPSGHDGEAIFQRLLAQLRLVVKHSPPQRVFFVRIEDILQAWFFDTPLTRIKKGNVADLLVYGFLYKSVKQLEDEGQGGLAKRWVRELEEASGVEFEEGHEPGLPFMSHLWQEVRCRYRPATFYAAIEALTLLKHAAFWGAGFESRTVNSVSYFCHGLPPASGGGAAGAAGRRTRATRTPASKVPGSQGSAPNGAAFKRSAPKGDSAAAAAAITVTATAHAAADIVAHAAAAEPSGAVPASPPLPPVLFLHGVGIGLLPYLTLLARIASRGLPVIAVEFPHLGMRWVDHLPDEEECASRVLAVMDAEGLGTVSLVGHSYGTFMASRLVQCAPHRLHSLVLIDPVCFLMYSGKLVRNFVYDPRNSPITTQIVSRDIHHAASVSRSFFWSLLNLWPDQLPHGGVRTLVVLSANDELVPVQETISMMREEAPLARVIVDTAGHAHAGFIKDAAWMDEIAAEVAVLALGPPAPGAEAGGGGGASGAAGAAAALAGQQRRPLTRGEQALGAVLLRPDDGAAHVGGSPAAAAAARHRAKAA